MVRVFYLWLTLVALASADDSKWPNRVPSTQDRGRQIYERSCASCHGPGAKGDGPLAPKLIATVPDLSSGFATRDVARFIPIVMGGKGAMPGFSESVRDLMTPSGNFEDAAEDVLRYMATLGGAPMPPDTRHRVTAKEIDAEIQAAQD